MTIDTGAARRVLGGRLVGRGVNKRRFDERTATTER